MDKYEALRAEGRYEAAAELIAEASCGLSAAQALRLAKRYPTIDRALGASPIAADRAAAARFDASVKAPEPVAVIDIEAPGNTWLAVYSDRSALAFDGSAFHHWLDWYQEVEPGRADVFVEALRPGFGQLVRNIRAALEEKGYCADFDY